MGKQLNDYIKYLNNNRKMFIKQTSSFILQGDSIIRDYTVTNYDPTKILPDSQKGRVHIKLIPQPVFGNIKDAEIIICSFNPGFSSKFTNGINNDYLVEDKELSKNNNCPYLRDIFLTQLGKSKYMPFIKYDEEINNWDGSIWWQKKFESKTNNDSLIEKIKDDYSKNQIILEDTDIYNLLSKHIATIELFPYHSKEKVNPKLLECYSVKRIKEVVNELINDSSKDNRIVCFTRSLKEWGIDENNIPKNVYINDKKHRQSFTFGYKSCIGKEIYKKIKELSFDFTKKI